jgi:tight adherence protein B
MWLIGLLVFASSFFVVFLAAQGLLRRRIATAERLSYYGRPSVVLAAPAPARGAGRALARVWERVDVRQSLDQLLDEAGILLTPGEFWMISLGCAAGFGVVGFAATRQVPVGLVGAIVGSNVPLMWVRAKRRQRRVRFDQQLPEALTAISSGLRAGFGLNQAMTIVIRDQPPPISKEFERAQREMQLGTTLDAALQGIVRRTASRDLDLAVSGMLISRQLGGNLAELLDSVVLTLRSRVRLKDLIRSLTAQQRLSAWVVLLVPPIMLVALILGMPDYASVLWSTAVGRSVLIVALLMQLTGMYFVRRIISIEV